MEPQENNDQLLKEYFQNVSVWYNNKFIIPFTHRSYSLCVLIYSVLLFLSIGIQIYKLFPLTTKVKYIIKLNEENRDKYLSIMTPESAKEQHLIFFAKYLVKNYIEQRETYNYNKLKEQILFIKSKSTPEIFNQYYQFLQTDNPQSPILRYEDQVKRFVQNISLKIVASNTINAQFYTIAYNPQGDLMENLLWNATINFDISSNFFENEDDKNFYFIVKDYRLKLLEDLKRNDAKN